MTSLPDVRQVSDSPARATTAELTAAIPADRFRWLAPAAGLALATAASLACLRLAGPAQGALFGACAIVALVVPSLAAGGRTSLVAFAAALATAAGALVGPANALRAGDLNLPAFLPAAGAVAALALAAAGLTLLAIAAASRWWAIGAAAVAVGLLAAWVTVAAGAGEATRATAGVGVGSGSGSAGTVYVAALVAAAATGGGLAVARANPSAAAWLVTLLLLAWLGWPVWLSPWLPGRDVLVYHLSLAHPLLAVDAALAGQNVAPWTEHRVMYNQLSVLQQHVAASPPRDVSATVLLHLALAAPGFAVTAAAEVVGMRRRVRAAEEVE